jgi:outer membrane protein assembly factor BamA
MLRGTKYCLWLLLAVASCQFVRAQDPGRNTPTPNNTENNDVIPLSDTVPGEKRLIIRTIIIEGSKRTKANVILREIPFKPGDAYFLRELVKKFELGRQRLMNTALFHEAIIALKSSEGYYVDILVQVKERWYIFPIPYFKPVDRNLNQWLFEQKASFKRVNYGAKLLWNNVTGRNDKLRFWLITGYTKKFSFSYDRLYFDNKMQWGYSAGFDIGKTKEINYNSVNDKQVFYRSEDHYSRNFTNIYAELTYRRAIKTRHRFGISYNREKLADTVIKLNPNYFGTPTTSIVYPKFYYNMTYYDVDYNPYPTKGYAAEINLEKKGVTKSMNLWQLAAKASGNWPTGRRTFFSLNVYGTIKLPFKQPYYTQQLLGYSDVFLQGYEYYVVDGAAGGYLKASLTRKIFNFDIRIPGTKKLTPQRVPINIFAKVYGNMGYIYNPYPGNNNLSNQMLYSSGFGIDIVSIYDFTLKLEWSFNQLGQNGLFLHRRTMF